ncbi:MAG TPA: hypothetical protein VII51_02125 [Gaiellaceae bacterium]
MAREQALRERRARKAQKADDKKEAAAALARGEVPAELDEEPGEDDAETAAEAV